jgi:hypothetical protein
MKTYKLTGAPKAEVLTQLDGQPVECIYKNPVMLPHPTLHGQIIVKVTPCSNACPAFDIVPKDHPANTSDGNNIELCLHCCARMIVIENETPKLTKI